ncbi:MAG: MtnX-like HAD-IB family phosphatase [Tissierellia bacterium]|nr:MtnX-like HAD-IB family phosphatase [Tissierellia bacterium]
MIKGLEGNFAILIDFDGTITKRDTNDLLVERYVDPSIRDLSQRDGGVNFMEYFGGLMSKVKITEEDYINFILNEIQLADGFYEFYLKARKLNIPLAVVSGGFENGIRPFLKKHGIEEVEILANRLKFDKDNLRIEFYHNKADCCDIGNCGNCKVLHYERYKKENDKVVFIGDGITDRAVASKADLVFAKDGLLRYCKANNLACIPWKDFDDISNILFGSKI